jgi:hypothetical protein
MRLVEEHARLRLAIEGAFPDQRTFVRPRFDVGGRPKRDWR